jgi:hypothetical protein
MSTAYAIIGVRISTEDFTKVRKLPNCNHQDKIPQGGNFCPICGKKKGTHDERVLTLTGEMYDQIDDFVGKNPGYHFATQHSGNFAIEYFGYGVSVESEEYVKMGELPSFDEVRKTLEDFLGNKLGILTDKVRESFGFYIANIRD